MTDKKDHELIKELVDILIEETAKFKERHGLKQEGLLPNLLCNLAASKFSTFLMLSEGMDLIEAKKYYLEYVDRVEINDLKNH